MSSVVEAITAIARQMAELPPLPRFVTVIFREPIAWGRLRVALSLADCDFDPLTEDEIESAAASECAMFDMDPSLCIGDEELP